MKTQLLPATSLPRGRRTKVLDGGVSWDGSGLRPAGREWDAVRMPEYLGACVLARLGVDCGAVIRDPYNHALYWLIRPGAADDWRFPPEAHVRVIGSTGFVFVPRVHLDRSPGPHWARPVVAGRVLTRSRRLHATMQRVIAEAGVSR